MALELYSQKVPVFAKKRKLLFYLGGKVGEGVDGRGRGTGRESQAGREHV